MLTTPSRRRLGLAFVISLLLALQGTLLGAPAANAITSTLPAAHLQTTSGPLTRSTVTIVGQRLGAISRVRFGSTVVGGVIHHGTTSLNVRAPSRSTPGRVATAILAGKTWISVGTYAYLARPVLTTISRHTSQPIGGAHISLSGSHLTPSPSVTVGSKHAPVLTATSSRLTVVVPPGLEGKVAVRVQTRGGTSYAQSLTYVLPSAGHSSSFLPASSTQTLNPLQVQWVDGGPDPAHLASTSHNSWVVSLVPGATIPSVGDGVLLAPGSSVFPSGLTGAVSSLASQTDGSTRVTVDPTALADTLSTASMRYSSTDTPTAARRAATGEVDQDFAGSASYSNLGASAFNCKNNIGDEVSFNGSLSLTFSRFHPEMYFSALAGGSFDAYVVGTVTVSGKITAESSLDCKLDPLWADAHRKVIPLADTGGTISFGPTAEVKLSVAGTFEVSQTTRFMYGASKYYNDPVQWYRIAKNLNPEVSLNSELALTASAGISIQLGLLDRVGAELKGQLFATGSLTAPIVSSNPQSCVTVSWGFSIGVAAFLDLFIARWESAAATAKISFDVYKKCNPVPGGAGSNGDPTINSTVLAVATLGEVYDASLSTADGRTGTWSLAQGASLPAGLSLTTDGEIVGTPTGGVGTWRPTVRFVDQFSRSTESAVKLVVEPSSGLGGGDIQATLTWDGIADLDLHAEEPDGNEIYYGNRGPSNGGGELDHDSNAGCNFVDPAPAENIHWPAGQAELGAYFIWVQTYDSCSSTDLSWHLVVRVEGQVVLDKTGSDTSPTYEIDYGSGIARVVARPRTTARAASKVSK